MHLARCLLAMTGSSCSSSKRNNNRSQAQVVVAQEARAGPVALTAAAAAALPPPARSGECQVLLAQGQRLLLHRQAVLVLPRSRSLGRQHHRRLQLH